ncbi:MAG: histidinol-phosphate transaminase [Desulforhopalus sp.]|nr:histidinol-phosphate transaminase [Desulforhopalus sp.]
MTGAAMINKPNIELLVPEYIKHFSPYIPSKPDDVLMKMAGCSRLYRLNNNENPLGPPPEARKIIESYPAPRASVYPSGDAYHLRCRLADIFGLHPDQFLVGNGANEVISFVIKAFCQEGDNIITADKTFAVYEWVATFSGFEARLVPLRDYGFDDEAMLSRIDERTKILFVCNPNNPTGSYWNEAQLRRFLDRVAGRQIVVIDEAYCEFVEKDDFPDGMQLLREYPNLVIFRTFSKMYALAGLRIGYLAGDMEVVDIIRRTCVVYSVNGLAQEAALKAIDDKEHVLATRKLVAETKTRLQGELAALGLTTVCGEGNFLMVRLPMNDSLAYRKLMMHGVMVRAMAGFRFPNWIRITVALPEAMNALVEALYQVMKNGR